MNKRKWYQSWIVIILSLICFWPVGLGLLLIRLKAEKKILLNVGRLISLIGWVSGLFFLVGTIGMAGDGLDGETIAFSLFFIGLSIALIVLGKKLRKKGNKYKNYIDLIVNKEMRDISSLAGTVDKPFTDVYSDVEEMIQEGYFKNAVIDENNRIILVNEGVQVEKGTDEILENFNETDKVKKVTIMCTGCGANNQILFGKITECEYCGTSIQG